MWKRIVIFTIIIVLFLSKIVFGQSLIVGGTAVSPNDDDDNIELKDGWGLLVAIDNELYSEDIFNVDLGLIGVYANYDEKETIANKTIKSHEDSYIFGLYLKPSIEILGLSPYVLAGAGTDSEYYEGLTGILGAGIDCNFYENWSFGISTLHIESNQRKYKLKYVFSIKYDF